MTPLRRAFDLACQAVGKQDDLSMRLMDDFRRLFNQVLEAAAKPLIEEHHAITECEEFPLGFADVTTNTGPFNCSGFYMVPLVIFDAPNPIIEATRWRWTTELQQAQFKQKQLLDMAALENGAILELQRRLNTLDQTVCKGDQA